MPNETSDGPSANLKSARVRRRKHLMLAAKIAILAALAWFVRKTIVEGISDLDEANFTIHWPWLVAGALFYAVANLPSAWFWWYSIVSLEQRLGLFRAFRAYCVGHLGKYVPGKALVVVLRAGLVRGPACDGGVAAACVFFETFTMMACGAAMAALIVLATFPDQWMIKLLAAGLSVATFVPTWPRLFRFAIKRAGVGRRDADFDRKLSGLVAKVVVVGWLVNIATWLLYGASLWATLSAIGSMQYSFAEAILPLTAASALAVVAGFASLIPGGFGVRELVLVELLRPFLAASGAEDVAAAAISSAVLLRLVWLFAELVLAAVIYPIRPRVPAGERLSAC